MKTHLSFATTDVAKSVEFYSVLLGTAPRKVLQDYALFVTDQPPLELALDAAESVAPTTDAHYGILVDTIEAVERAIVRLQNAGLASAIQRAQTCCYANQTKVWTIDPMGHRWEIYMVHEDTEERDSADGACCADASNIKALCCPA